MRHQDLADTTDAESSSAIRARVETARHLQQQRFAGSKTVCNAAMSPRQLRRFCALDDAGQS
ncbi:MAG: hypothetical protein R2864_12305 [Syntrophotaleaceae bacterium]